MKKLITILALILFCATCYAETKIAIRLAPYDGEVYTIVFEYSDKPLPYPSNVPHYAANISVYQGWREKQNLVGETFTGYFTDGACYEDNPQDLIRIAQLSNWK